MKKAFGLAVVLLLVATPVYADDPVSGQTTIIELPVAVPNMPAPVEPLQVDEFPTLTRAQLPQIATDLPSRMSAINTAATTSDNLLNRAESMLSSNLSAATARIDQARSVVTSLRLRVGSPTSANLMRAQNASGAYVTYTAYGAASEMADSIYYTTAYLRGLSNLGGVGLNLTFILIGLVWVAFMNLITPLLKITALLIKFALKAVVALFNIGQFLINVASAIANWIDVLTGPLT